MSWIVGIILFFAFVWAMAETPEDRKAADKCRHEAAQDLVNFIKSEQERKRKEIRAGRSGKTR